MILGGTAGIGKACALALASAGAAVAVGARTASTHSCKAEFEAQGNTVLAINVDIRSTDSVQDFYAAVVNRLGKVDILVNAAGIYPTHLMCDHPDELWHRVIDVNLNGVYRTIKLCLPGMLAHKWGRIINIASTAASVGSPEYAAYCASKAAVVGLTRCVALEGARDGVTCNAISPGWVETNSAKNHMRTLAEAEGSNLADYTAAIKQANPQQRMIQAEEIAALAVFLCSDQALGITMQDLTVSAGALW